MSEINKTNGMASAGGDQGKVQNEPVPTYLVDANKELIKTFDEDKNGQLSMEEFSKMWKTNSWNPTVEDAKKFLENDNKPLGLDCLAQARASADPFKGFGRPDMAAAANAAKGLLDKNTNTVSPNAWNEFVTKNNIPADAEKDFTFDKVAGMVTQSNNSAGKPMITQSDAAMAILKMKELPSKLSGSEHAALADKVSNAERRVVDAYNAISQEKKAPSPELKKAYDFIMRNQSMTSKAMGGSMPISKDSHPTGSTQPSVGDVMHLQRMLEVCDKALAPNDKIDKFVKETGVGSWNDFRDKQYFTAKVGYEQALKSGKLDTGGGVYSNIVNSIEKNEEKIDAILKKDTPTQAEMDLVYDNYLEMKNVYRDFLKA